MYDTTVMSVGVCSVLPCRSLQGYLRVRGVLDYLELVVHLERGEQTDLVRAHIAALAEAVPVVAGDAHHVPRHELHLARGGSLVGVQHHLVVGRLAAVVVDVVQRLEARCRVREVVLHYFVRYSTHLKRI